MKKYRILWMLLALLAFGQTARAQGYDISQCTLSGVYKAKSIFYAEGWLQFPVVTAPDGTVLERGTDYTLTATLPHETVLDVTDKTSGFFFLGDPLYDEMVINRMYVTLTVEGIGSHSGTQSVTYRLFCLFTPDWRFNFEDCCFIRDPEEYNLVAQAWNEGQEFYEPTLIIDGDMTFDPDNLTIDNDGDGIPESNFIPLGTAEHPFSGTIKSNVRYLTMDGYSKLRPFTGIRCHTNSGSTGFFGNLTGTADGIAISDAQFTGPGIVGGLAGTCSGTIKNCLVANSTITSTGGGNTGAIVGQNDGTTFTNTYYSACTVGGTANATDAATSAGDVAGTQVGIPVTGPANTTILVDEQSATGVSLDNHTLYAGAGEEVKIDINRGTLYTTVNDTYTVTGGTIVPGDYGCHYEQIYWYYIVPGEEIWPEDAHYHSTYDYPNDHDGLASVISHTLAIAADATQGQGVSITPNNFWGTLDGCDGSEEHPYVIRTPEGIELLATAVNNIPTEYLYYSGHASDNLDIGTDDQGHAIWMRYDVDFSGIDHFHFQLGNDIAYDPNALTIDLDGNGTPESNHTPIGKGPVSLDLRNCHHFSGYFDGCGHTISGIRTDLGITNTASDAGLFGIIGWRYYDNNNYEGTVTNVTLTDARIRGRMWIGGIAGEINVGSAVSNCFVKSGVYVEGSNQVGGIVGENNKSTITNCHVMDGDYIHGSSWIDSFNDYRTDIHCLGGIVGYCVEGTVANCTSTAQFTFDNDVTELEDVGGIAGFNDGTLSNCLAIGTNIPSFTTMNGVGAIVGEYYGTLDHNYYVNCTVGGATSNIGYGYQDGSNYVTSDLTANDGAVPLRVGDTNGDGSITIADVTALVNIILGKEGTYNDGAADVNGDGTITIADVTALVNIILGK